MTKRTNASTFYLPYNPALIPRARALRKNMTPAEKKLWFEYFRSLNIRVLRQRPIDNFIVDFYCASAKLVIEVDGDSHPLEGALVYDIQRTQVLAGYGLELIRFNNRDVLASFEGVCERIEELIAARISIPPTPP